MKQKADERTYIQCPAEVWQHAKPVIFTSLLGSMVYGHVQDQIECIHY